MLNISIYLSQPLEENIAYINKMAKLGIKEVFTSLQVPEEGDLDQFSIKKIAETCYENGLNLVADISPNTLKKFNINKNEMLEFFEKLGLTGVRLDYGFTSKEIKAISEKMLIVLNASTLTEEIIKEYQEVELDFSRVKICHNYYPRKETGLDKNFFINKNKWLKSLGFIVSAFVAGDGVLRGPIYSGLPTIEDHRFRTPFSAYLDLLQNCDVDEVYIGDIDIKDSSYKQFEEYLNHKKVLLHCSITITDSNLLKRLNIEHTNRKDVARDCIRSSKSRIIEFEDNEIIPENTIFRKKGSITIDNELYGRYMGEIQITKADLKEDEKVNVLGEIHEKDLELLNYIGSGTEFKLEF